MLFFCVTPHTNCQYLFPHRELIAFSVLSLLRTRNTFYVCYWNFASDLWYNVSDYVSIS